MLMLTIESYITIVGNTSEPFTLSGLEVCLPWKYDPATLLQDPADDLRRKTFNFPNQKSGGYDRSEVIAQSNRTLTGGRFTSGWLLAYDLKPIPREFRHGSELPIILNIIDQFDNSHLRELLLMVNRLNERESPKPTASRPRRSLFAKPDAQKTKTEEVYAAR
jgi:hypothetical protein